MQETFEQLLQHAGQAWRWRWLGMAVCWFVVIFGTGYVAILPDVYESEARIRVDSDSALRPLMEGLAVNTNLEDQVRIMEQTLLSRPNLEQVARTVDLDVTVTNEAQQQSMLLKLKNRIKVRSAGGQLFSVSYKDTNPARAREVVQSLLTIFIESNLGENREDMEQAELFLSAQIKAYEGQLKAAEESQARFRSENMAILSTAGSYIDKIEAAQVAIAKTDQAMQEANVTVEQLNQRLGVTPRFLRLGETSSANGSQGGSSTYGRIQSLQNTLDELLLQYTESHPDVISVKQRIASLVDQYNREKSGEREPATLGPQMLNPVFEQVSLRLVDAKSEVTRLERRKLNAEEWLMTLGKKASIAPSVEAEMAALNRGYGTIKAQYESLLGRREAARLSRAIEATTDSIQFRTVDPPQIPAEPSGPPRGLYLFVVLLAAFGVGGGAAFVRSQLSDTFSVPTSLSETFHIPVIGTVSRVSDLAVRAKGFVGNITFFGAAAVPVVIIVGAAIVMPYTARLREAIELSPLGTLL
jgi:protein tyrosine kinase modulator